MRGIVYAGIRSGGLLAALALLLAGSGALASVQSELAFHRGVVAYGDGKLEEARQAFEAVLAEDPEDGAALHYLGLIAQDQDRSDDAIALYERALALEPDDADLRFDLGSALLEAGRNAEARESFAKVLAVQPERARAHLLAGIAAYREEDYAEAVSHLDRAAELDPSLALHARYYTGLSEAMRGELGTAAGAFDDVTEASPAHPLSRSAGSLRKQVQPTRPVRRWALALTAGLEFDSNPLIAGEGFDREPDGRGVYRVRSNFRVWEDERYRAEIGYDAFFSTHFDETRVDLQIHDGWAALSANFAPVRLSLRYDYAYTALDMSKKFRGINRVTPSALITEGDWGVLQTFFQYQRSNYFGGLLVGPLDRDGNQYGFGANQFFMLPPPFRYLRIGAAGDFLQPQGSEFWYDAYEVNAGFGAMLPFELELTTLYRFIDRDFRNQSIFPRSPGGPVPSTEQDLFLHILTAEVARQLGEHWEVSVAAALNFHDSDVGIYDYDRHIVGSYVTYRF